MATIGDRLYYEYEKLKLPESIRVLELQPSGGEASRLSDESYVYLIVWAGRAAC